MLAAGVASTAQGERLDASLVAALTPSTQRATPGPYVDRVLETGPQPDTSPGDDDGYDSKGWARSLRFETSLGASRGPTASVSRGIAFGGYLETPDYGTLSIQGNAVDTAGESSPLGLAPRTTTNTWRLDQRGLPLPGGWLANHSAGDINTLVPGLGRGVSRVFLPSTPIAGVGGEWLLDDQAAVNASAGQPGLFSGFDISGFQPSRGQLVTAGAQLRLRGDRNSLSRVDAAVQAIEASDAEQMGVPRGTQSNGTWAALAWQGEAPWGDGISGGNRSDPVAQRPGGARAQLSLLQSGGSATRSGTGLWLDSAWRTEYVQNTAGVFRFDPELRWGVTSMPGDLQGGYWRGDIATRRWQLGWNAESSSSLTNQYGSSLFASLYARYVLTLRNAVDATLSMRQGSGAADSLQVNWDHTTQWGQTRWRASYLRSDVGHTLFFGADQTWAMSAPTVFGTSVGWQGSDMPGSASPIWTWAVLASASPMSRVTLDAGLHGARGGQTSSLFANVGVNWQFARDWALGLRYTESRGQDPQSAQVISALTAATQVAQPPVPSSRSLQATLRYETHAGTLPVPLGGSRTSGAGAISGTVFYDADHNGHREPSEGGVPNVTVVLDGRYVARTDSAGHYEFPAVVSGEHVLQVQPDNVPLPWSPADGNPVKITVIVRGRTIEDFPMQRER